MKLDKLIEKHFKPTGAWQALDKIWLCSSKGAKKKFGKWKVDWSEHDYWIVINQGHGRNISTGGPTLNYCMHVLSDMLDC